MSDEACSLKWYKEYCFSYKELLKHLREAKEYADDETTWVFRGQPTDKELRTTLERECDKSGISLTKANHIEEIIVREFRRVYEADDRPDVLNDTLYCLSLLQHHGAPTRLLDFTYSQFIAFYFGLKTAYDSISTSTAEVSFALWCINATDMDSRAKTSHPDDPIFNKAFKERAHISKRKDESFQPLYLNNKYDFVTSENPAKVHKRLHLQQGVHLCIGNVKTTFMDNLHYLYASANTMSVRKLVCKLNPSDLKEAFEYTKRINITEESLFPGIDGQARSMKYQLQFNDKLWRHIHKAGGS